MGEQSRVHGRLTRTTASLGLLADECIDDEDDAADGRHGRPSRGRSTRCCGTSIFGEHVGHLRSRSSSDTVLADYP